MLLQAIETARRRSASDREPRGRSGREARASIDSLSERQRQVLAGVVRGRPNKVIAWELGLSIRTVEAYRAQMLDKLGARGTAEAVRMALAAESHEKQAA